VSASRYDAVVVGSGPNGLAAAITLQTQGIQVLLIEGKDTIGGGLRSAELTLPGFTHDICSAIHPLAAGSPFFNTLPLDAYGLEWVRPTVAAAHPFEDGGATALLDTVEDTAKSLGKDAAAYRKLMDPLAKEWPLLAPQLLGPLRFPAHPLSLARFGLLGLPAVTTLARRFQTREARALLAGMAAHSMQSLDSLSTAAVALVFLMAGHGKGWPFPRYGASQLAMALGAYFESLGGVIETDTPISRLDQLPASKALLLDLSPQQLLTLGGHRWSSLYKWQ